MAKTRLVLASVLKPVNDTRMFEKFAVSLSQSNKYDINIIGFSVKKTPRHPNIHTIPLYSFHRLSLKRLLAPVQYGLKLLQVKPKIIIINTPEILVVSIAYKILFGAKLVYDVQENYYRNIACNDLYPTLLKWPLAVAIRLKEHFCSPLINHFILAERCYVQELSFINEPKNRHTVLENKYVPLLPAPKEVNQPVKGKLLQFVLTGTLAKGYGTLDAIRFIDQMHAIYPNCRLHIIGYSANADFYQQILKYIAGKSYIQLTGGNQLVPHKAIIEAIKQAHFGLVCYHPNKSTENCLPTKLFEYMYNKLPVLLVKNPLWQSFCAQYKAAYPISFNTFNPENTLNALFSTTFYTSNTSPNQLLWANEATKLLQVLNSL